MFLTVSFLTLLLALSITGSPVEVRNSPIILPLTRRLNFSDGTINLVQHDKARVATFRDYNMHGRRAESICMTYSQGRYIIALNVGSPPTTYNLVVDTGSGVTWIGARTPYGETGVNTGQGVKETYGGGLFPNQVSFSGTFVVDTVTLGDLTIPNYELAVASTVSSFGDFDGILGLGPRDLTVSTLTNDPLASYPTFTDWLVTASAIRQNIVGIFFQPFRTGDGDTGQLVFGEPDYTKCTSNIVYTDITNTRRSQRYWGLDQRITYGNRDINILFPTAGIIDTGCNFIYIASDAYGRYRAATGATINKRNGLLRITPRQYSALQELKFHIGNGVFSLSPNAQIWPRSLNHRIRAEKDDIYLIIKSLSGATGAGLDFIIGWTFMQRFYTVLDRDNRKIGFAMTPFTYDTSN
ncbi:aspartic peptidase domain-containing protein [Suillus spraguei]|nr:aspartic peptidase domain-containing protein [Suillus spraguei]